MRQRITLFALALFAFPPSAVEATPRRIQVKVVILFISFVGCLPNQAKADLLLPGHKSIKHQLVFESSALFDDYRLVAAPIRGFQGVHVVAPGQPFQFSSKYGTRIYLIPESVSDVSGFDPERFEQWPSAHPPVSQIRSVPVTSPVATAVTTVQFASLRDGKPVIHLVDHKVLDSSGRPVSYWRAYWWLTIPIVGGILLLGTVFRRLRSRVAKSGQSVSADAC